MKNKTWIILAVIIILIVIGYYTNWFGLGKTDTTTSTNGTGRLASNSQLNKPSCPEGYSLYTNSLNGHSICVKLATGEIVQPINN